MYNKVKTVKNQPKYGIDFAKFLCSILVVAIHTHPIQYGTIADYYFNCFCRIAVPFFFVTSSYFYYTKGGGIKKYIRRLLILYVCWFVVEIPFTIKVYFFDADGSILLNSFKFIRGLLINNSFFASWFLTALMEGMLIIHLLENKRTLLNIIGVSCFVLGLVWCMWFGLIRGTQIESNFTYFCLIFMPAQSFIIAIPYLLIGKLIAEKKVPIIPSLLSILFVTLAFIEIYICRNTFNKPFDDVYLSLVPLTIIVFQIANKIKYTGSSWLSSICIFLRKSSILIYLTHPIFVYIFLQTDWYKNDNLTNSLLLFLTVLTCSIISSLVLIALSNRFLVLKKMY